MLKQRVKFSTDVLVLGNLFDIFSRAEWWFFLRYAFFKNKTIFCRAEILSVPCQNGLYLLGFDERYSPCCLFVDLL